MKLNITQAQTGRTITITITLFLNWCSFFLWLVASDGLPQSSFSRRLTLIITHHKFWKCCGCFSVWSGPVDRRAMVLRLVAPFSLRVLNFPDPGRPACLGKDDEWVSGGGSRWAALGGGPLSCHLCSAGLAVGWEARADRQAGRQAGSRVCGAHASAVIAPRFYTLEVR